MLEFIIGRLLVNTFGIFTLGLILLWIKQGQCYSIPSVQSLVNISTPMSTYGQILDIKAYTQYIARLSDTGRLDLWSNGNFTHIVTYQSGIEVLINIPDKIIDFNIDTQDNTYLVILTDTTFNIINITLNTLLQTTSITSMTGYTAGYKFLNVSITQTSLFVLQTNSKLYRINRTDLVVFQVLYTYLTAFTKLNTCQNNLGQQYTVLWSNNDLINMLQCIGNAACSLYFYHLYPSANRAGAWNINTVKFGAQCKYLYVEIDSKKQPFIYDIAGIQNHLLFDLVTQKIRLFTSLDELDLYSLIFLQNNTMMIYDNTVPKLTNFITQTITSIMFSPIMNYDFKVNKLWFGFNDSLAVYEFQCLSLTYMQSKGICSDCDSLCQNCSNLNGFCYQCVDSQFFKSINGICVRIYKSSLDNIQQHISEFSIQSFKFISDFITALFILLTVTPLGPVFLSFINYWQICSIYLFLDIEKPQYITRILKAIYDAINKSILQLLGINQDSWRIDEELNQKFDQNMNQNYGISSKFFLFNTQTLIFLGINLLVIISLKMIQKYVLKKQSWLKNKLNIDYFKLMIGQYVAVCSSFFLSLSILTDKIYQNNFYQRKNVVFHIIFIGLSFISPFLFVSFYRSIQVKKQSIISFKNKPIQIGYKKVTFTKFNQITKQNKLNKLKKASLLQQKQKQGLKLLQQFYIAESNILASFLVMLGYDLFFLILLCVVFVCGLYQAHRQKRFRVNKIILNSYYLVFHLCLVGFKVCDLYEEEESSQQASQIIGIVCMIVLIIGALHQIGSLIFKIGYKIYRIYKQFKSLRDVGRRVQNDYTTNNQNKLITNTFDNKQSLKMNSIQLMQPTKRVSLKRVQQQKISIKPKFPIFKRDNKKHYSRSRANNHTVKFQVFGNLNKKQQLMVSQNSINQINQINNQINNQANFDFQVKINKRLTRSVRVNRNLLKTVLQSRRNQTLQIITKKL